MIGADGKLLGALVVMGPTSRMDEHPRDRRGARARGTRPQRGHRGRPAQARRPPSSDEQSTPPRWTTRPRAGVGAIALRVLLPAPTIIALIGLWWLATIVFDWPAYLVPTPGEVWNEMVDQRSLLASDFKTTLFEASSVSASRSRSRSRVAVAIAYSRLLELTIYPALVALNAIPKIAIAPLLVIWMGFGIGPKIAMVVLICFFPIVISTATGLKSTPAELVELARSLSASTSRSS